MKNLNLQVLYVFIMFFVTGLTACCAPQEREEVWITVQTPEVLSTLSLIEDDGAEVTPCHRGDSLQVWQCHTRVGSVNLLFNNEQKWVAEGCTRTSPGLVMFIDKKLGSGAEWHLAQVIDDRAQPTFVTRGGGQCFLLIE